MNFPDFRPLTALTIALFVASGGFSQPESQAIEWDDLKDVRFEPGFDENSETAYELPVFGNSLEKLEGTSISITGYVIPMDINLNYYVVSAYPFAACFFCGSAGPESVIDLQLTKEHHFKNDQKVTFCGELVLNKNSFFELPFALRNAEVCD